MTWEETEIELARIYSIWREFPPMPSKVKNPREWEKWNDDMERLVRVPSKAMGDARWNILIAKSR